MKTLHWAYDYLGKPWVLGTDGPDTYDCWGLVRAVQADRFDRYLPPIALPACTGVELVRKAMVEFRSNPELLRWHEVTTPQDGDGVMMSAAKHPWHVGVWVDADGGGVLHCLAGAGVVFTKITALKNAGWGHIRIMRFAG